MRVLGVDFGGTKVAVGLGQGRDDAEIIKRSFPSETKATEVLTQAVSISDNLLQGGGKPEVVSLTTPGVVVDNRIEFAPNVDGWGTLDLHGWARQTWPDSRIVISNDVKAAAAAEARAGNLLGANPGLYVNLGTGIAAAVVVDGEVVMGANGLAGEIGYVPVPEASDLTDPEASVENFAGGIGFKRAGITVPEEPDDAWWSSPEGRGAETRLGSLVRLLGACALLVDPAVIVLGGGMSTSPVVVDALRRGLAGFCPSKPQVQISRFGSDASLVGALLLGSAK